MPTYKDEKGGSHFSMNPQVGKARFSHAGGVSPKGGKGDGGEMTTGHGSSATFLHAHGDGTYHTEHEHNGERIEHPSLGHALMHMAHHHEPSGKHVHIHSHDGGHDMHHADESGNVQGPEQHGDLESVKNSLDQALGEGGEQNYGSGSGGNDNDSGNGSDSSHLME